MSPAVPGPVPVQSIPGSGQNPRYYSNVRYEMTPFIPPRYQRVLEIGCGDGVSTVLFPAASEYWGVEMMQAAAEQARTVMHRVLVGTFDAVRSDLPLGYFDLVVCHDVIEHMVDPEAFLRSLRPHLAPGAYLMSSIPNMRHWEVLAMLLFARDWRYMRDGIMDGTHMRFFTERSIRRLFEENGFKVLRHAGINGVFQPGRRLLLRAFALLTLGTYADIQYRQFGTLAQLT